MTIGEKLKKIRISLGLNQDEMAAGVMNRSFYSRIENDESRINSMDLLRLLQVHNISVFKFLDDKGNTKARNSLYQDLAALAYQQKNLSKLEEILNDQNFTNQKVKQIVQLMIHELRGTIDEFPQPMLNNLKYNVLEMGAWDENALWTLSYSMVLYDYHDLRGLVDSIFNRFKEQKELDRRTVKLLARLTINYLAVCLKQKHSLIEMRKSIRFIANLPNDANIVTEKAIALRVKAMLNGEQKQADEIGEILKEVISK